MISFNITGGRADCQGKNRLFLLCRTKKVGFLIDSREILLLDFTKNSIKTFFSAISAGQGTIRSFSVRLFVVFNLLWK